MRYLCLSMSSVVQRGLPLYLHFSSFKEFKEMFMKQQGKTYGWLNFNETTILISILHNIALYDMFNFDQNAVKQA